MLSALLLLSLLPSQSHAERFKSCIMRMALVKRCSSNHVSLADSLEAVVDALGTLVMVSQLAASRQLLEVQMWVHAAGLRCCMIIECMHALPRLMRRLHAQLWCGALHCGCCWPSLAVLTCGPSAVLTSAWGLQAQLGYDAACFCK